MEQRMKLRSGAAMRVVNLAREKFNQAVSDGYYPCAPHTVAGSVRLFQEGDLIVLFAFARLLEIGVLPRRAGELACELFHKLRTYEAAGAVPERLIYVRGLNDDFIVAAEQYDPDHDKHDLQYGVGTIVLTLDFYIGAIRRLIKAGVERERSTVGIEGADD